MGLSQFITLISWSFASSLLLVFTIVAVIIYRDNGERVFRFYALYCFLMLLYCVTKIPDFFYSFSQVVQWKSHAAYQSLYWFLQVLFHNAYLSFGIYFLNLKETAPRLTRQILIYQKIIVPAYGLLVLLVLTGIANTQVLLQAFSYIFIELHLVVCFLIIYAVRKTHFFLRDYFVLGSLVYMVMILLSFGLSAANISLGAVRPPAVFFAAISLECLIFSGGLGLRIRDVYRDKMKFQEDLNAALRKVQAQMGLQLEKQELAARNNELNSQVLRSQMNSHFIFNVLTGIRLFIRERETEKALDYLGKFSRFIRRVLDGSIYENSTLQEELETLELYLSIEKIRFSEDLKFLIVADESLDLHSVQFPAMLLQPFAENALWHGLREKNGEKILEIRIARTELGCTITLRDNGIGRNPLQQDQPEEKNKLSHGLKIVNRRIAFFNENSSSQIAYKVKDRTVGTEVLLTLTFAGEDVRLIS